jgi:O-antigen/teichoic acid export membrane protein
MCFSLCLASISTPSMQAIKAVGRSDITLKQEIIKKSVFLLIILITAFISVWAVVIGSAIGEIWCAIVNAYPNKKLFNYSFRDQIMDILPNGLCALFMAVIVYMISFINLPLILELIIQVIVGGVIYVGIAKLTKNESYIYCKENLNFFKKR